MPAADVEHQPRITRRRGSLRANPHGTLRHDQQQRPPNPAGAKMEHQAIVSSVERIAPRKIRSDGAAELPVAPARTAVPRREPREGPGNGTYAPSRPGARGTGPAQKQPRSSAPPSSASQRPENLTGPSRMWGPWAFRLARGARGARYGVHHNPRSCSARRRSAFAAIAALGGPAAIVQRGRARPLQPLKHAILRIEREKR